MDGRTIVVFLSFIRGFTLTSGDFTDGDFPSNVTVGNPIAMTPVLGNNALLASLSEESVSRVAVGEGEKGEEGERKGERIINEGVEPPKMYSVVSRKHSGKRMRCEEGEEGDKEKTHHLHVRVSRISRRSGCGRNKNEQISYSSRTDKI